MRATTAKFPLFDADNAAADSGQYMFGVERPNAFVIPGATDDAPATVRIEIFVDQPKIPADGSPGPIGGTKAAGVFTGDLQKSSGQFLLSVSKIGIRIENLGAGDDMAKLIVEFEAPGSVVSKV